MSSIWRMNHGSILVSEQTSSRDIPRSSASKSQWMRSGPGTWSFSRKSAVVTSAGARQAVLGSRERMALQSDS